MRRNTFSDLDEVLALADEDDRRAGGMFARTRRYVGRTLKAHDEPPKLPRSRVCKITWRTR